MPGRSPRRWCFALIIAGHAWAACCRRSPSSDPWKAYCDSDDALLRRGVPETEVRLWNELATKSVKRLLRVWNEGSRHASSSSRVFMVGDSMMGNVYQALWCAAVRAGCSVKQGATLEMLTGGGYKEYTPEELLLRDKVTRNPVTESIVQRHRVSCPDLGFAVKLVWVKFWWFDEPGKVGDLNIRQSTLLNLTRYADFMYANIGHDVSQPGNGWKIPAIVAALAEAAEAARSRRAGGADRMRAFVVERPPKHFVGFGNGTGDHAPPGLFHGDAERRKASKCSCDQPNHDKSFLAAGNAGTRAAVEERNKRMAPGQHPLGLIGKYTASFLKRPRCLLHHRDGDCTHYLHHPGIWYPVIEEMCASARPLPMQASIRLQAHTESGL